MILPGFGQLLTHLCGATFECALEAVDVSQQFRRVAREATAIDGVSSTRSVATGPQVPQRRAA